ncbi:forkhead box protein P2-like [Teleopsis dalmanni]|uniref:forkhead box protein P2-like n=1 Tax=Teleopsis dalmanni TaxID=139649 RepID=UPI0018CF018D|nr:forkhead box protein P2-like [Teleopsis dalmanni]
MQVVSQLELHLQKERDRLQAMMHHLYLTKQFLSPKMKEFKDSIDQQYKCISAHASSSSTNSKVSQELSASVSNPLLNSGNTSTLRKRVNDKPCVSLSGGMCFVNLLPE